MSSLVKYILDNPEVRTYDFLYLTVSRIWEKPVGLMSIKDTIAIIFEGELEVKLELANLDGKEKKQEPKGIETYLKRLIPFNFLDKINITYFNRLGDILIQYYFQGPYFQGLEKRREAEKSVKKFEKLAKDYGLKPFTITFPQISENFMNVYVPLNSKSIELLTKLEKN
jgi:hypothetical protein